MISKININNVASFNKSNHLMDNLGRINFIFGANGSGKTTISRVLAHSENYPSCRALHGKMIRFCRARFIMLTLLSLHLPIYPKCQEFLRWDKQKEMFMIK